MVSQGNPWPWCSRILHKIGGWRRFNEDFGWICFPSVQQVVPDPCREAGRGGADEQRKVGNWFTSNKSLLFIWMLHISILISNARWGSGDCQTPEDKSPEAGSDCQGFVPSMDFEEPSMGSSPAACPATPVEHTPHPMPVETPEEPTLTPAEETPRGKCATPGSKVEASSVRPRSIGF